MTRQERDAWAAAYRIYDEYAPKLRQAASAGDTEMAGNIVLAADERINKLYNASDPGGKLILFGVGNILHEVCEAGLQTRRGL